MRRHTTLLMAVVLVTSMVAVPVAGLAATGEVGPAQTDESTDDEGSTNGTESVTDENGSVAPGERFAGVVGVQEAEIEGEVDERTFGIEVAQAASNDSKADVVKAQLGDIEQRLDRLEQRKQTLDEARANGSISEGKYRAEVSQLATQIETTKRLANQSETVSQGLPADTLESKNISVSSIQALAERANTLGGPEVAEIARDIAGPNVGQPADDRGPGELPERPERTDSPDERPAGQDGTQSDDETTTDDSTDDGTDETPDGQNSDRTPGPQ